MTTQTLETRYWRYLASAPEGSFVETLIFRSVFLGLFVRGSEDIELVHPDYGAGIYRAMSFSITPVGKVASGGDQAVEIQTTEPSIYESIRSATNAQKQGTYIVDYDVWDLETGTRVISPTLSLNLQRATISDSDRVITLELSRRKYTNKIGGLHYNPTEFPSLDPAYNV